MFDAWQQRRTLASFDWTDLGTFAGEKKLAQVWLALSRGRVGPGEGLSRRAVETPSQLRSNYGRHTVVGRCGADW